MLRTILPEVLPGMLATSINVEGIAGAAANTVLHHLRVESSQLRDVVISVVKSALPDVLLELPSLDNILKPLAEVALDKHFDEARYSPIRKIHISHKIYIELAFFARCGHDVSYLSPADQINTDAGI